MRQINKRSIAKFISWLRVVKTWQLVIILVIGTVLAVSLLRLNNLGMIERKEAVKVADASGDKEELRHSLVELQSYVSSHMNTSLGPNGFYLEKTFERDRAAALEAISDSENPNADVYQEASIECRSRFQGGVESFRNDYVQCVADRVAALSSADSASSLYLPPPGQYQINYVSPLWSADIAGFMVLFCLLVTVVIIVRLLLLGVLRLIMRRRFQTI